MKRVAVAAAVASLALPASAYAATFKARVLRSDALQLVVRRDDGRKVTYTAAQIAGLPSAATAAGGRRRPLAHMAGGPRSAGGGITALDPGLLVAITETGNGTVTVGLPAGIGARHRVAGVVSATAGGSILLDTSAGLELRLRGAVAGVRPCQRASVVYHQDALTLVADRVTVTGATDCAG
jgi:hypothetical protein